MHRSVWTPLRYAPAEELRFPSFSPNPPALQSVASDESLVDSQTGGPRNISNADEGLHHTLTGDIRDISTANDIPESPLKAPSPVTMVFTILLWEVSKRSPHPPPTTRRSWEFPQGNKRRKAKMRRPSQRGLKMAGPKTKRPRMRLKSWLMKEWGNSASATIDAEVFEITSKESE